MEHDDGIWQPVYHLWICLLHYELFLFLPLDGVLDWSRLRTELVWHGEILRLNPVIQCNHANPASCYSRECEDHVWYFANLPRVRFNGNVHLLEQPK